HRAGLLMTDGRFIESVPVAEEAIAVARVVGAAADEALALGVLGWDLALLGHIDDGVLNIRRALVIADELGGVEGIALGATNLAALAELAAARGKLIDARSAVADGLTMAAEGPPDPALASLAAVGLRVEADAGDAARARHDEVALADARRHARVILREVDRVAGLSGIPAGVVAATATPTRDAAMAALCRAEARRLEIRDQPDDWAAVAGAF